MTVTQIERRKIEFLLSTNIPEPEYRIGQLVEVFTEKDWNNPDDKRWFPARVTGMAWSEYHGVISWEYQVMFLNSDGEPFQWFSPSEMWLLEP